MSLERAAEVITALGFPRVSGDEPVPNIAISCANQFSPRERG